MTPQGFASLALRLTVLVACIAIVNLARRRASAADRHWLWMLGCAGMLILPIHGNLAADDNLLAIDATPPVSPAMPGVLTWIWIIGSVFFSEDSDAPTSSHEA